MLDAPTAGDPVYRDLAQHLRGLLGGERDAVADRIDAATLIFATLPGLDCPGFYRLRGGVLVLGPFQGRPAGTRIPPGRGMCGAAVVRRASVLVVDVHAFPGHIACDAASRSELVVPAFDRSTLRGVLDLDSPIEGRFAARDQAGVAAMAAIVAAASDWPAEP